jgi:hypothetical protein
MGLTDNFKVIADQIGLYAPSTPAAPLRTAVGAW